MIWKRWKVEKQGTSYPGFDAKYYLKKYPDVKAAGVDPLEHYITKGWKEGRDPNRYFSTSGYLRANSDVHELGIEPLAHFLDYGMIEGRGGWRRDENAAILADGNEAAQTVNQATSSITAPTSVETARAPSAAKDESDQIKAAIAIIYMLALRRNASADELNIWNANIARGETLANAIILLATCDEAKDARAATQILPTMSDGEFVQHLYTVILGRGALPDEIELWQTRLAGTLSRQQLLGDLFQDATQKSGGSQNSTNDPSRISILGTDLIVSREDWVERRSAVRSGKTKSAMVSAPIVFRLGDHDKRIPVVSAIASLYKGDKYIDHFMDMIVNQTIFEKYAELIVIDANSPGNEERTIDRFRARFKNIKYIRTTDRIDIYSAWNIGIRQAKGMYITNVNLDDVRRSDSFEIQASTLDRLPFVDVVYQDVYYTFEENMSFVDVASVGIMSNLPIVTPYNILAFNSPHNGPMWRRRLHDEIGLFDETFKSAGDFDFWVRCASHGKTFFKIPTSTVAYYVNPHGISTSSETIGVTESHNVTKRHASSLVQAGLTCEASNFVRRICDLAPNCEVPSQSEAAWRYKLCQNALYSLAMDA